MGPEPGRGLSWAVGPELGGGAGQAAGEGQKGPGGFDGCASVRTSGERPGVSVAAGLV